MEPPESPTSSGKAATLESEQNTHTERRPARDRHPINQMGRRSGAPSARGSTGVEPNLAATMMTAIRVCQPTSATGRLREPHITPAPNTDRPPRTGRSEQRTGRGSGAGLPGVRDGRAERQPERQRDEHGDRSVTAHTWVYGIAVSVNIRRLVELTSRTSGSRLCHWVTIVGGGRAGQLVRSVPEAGWPNTSRCGCERKRRPGRGLGPRPGRAAHASGIRREPR
jgi:hypothetical protein